MSICTYSARLQQRRAELSTMIDMQETFSGYSCDDSVDDRLMDLRERLADVDYDLRQHRLEQQQENRGDSHGLSYYISGR
ncbi:MULTISPECIES: hypothetical protein [Rhizobium/Agrobacterium group]|uniref:Uncharacterized protein n=1 Tax=Agrobacterium vitis TaxID=373 RepID=A0AAE5AMD5_AGRVI|nr:MULTISPECIES: hypothetical protein [Rhizobium/Agrobacterium group]MBF2714760.1 hypothetical protein [Agrobacterium vitis]MCF1447996.1 hypothetical protein [Allorhizobium ampelinum]MCF1462028.1 hypothetical protein [Allorhizobium ampelinum]MCF1473355.1 hypothetical protein [Allorhizobium ampelinum]MCF1484038.1 hypothetical protein [Allorhizobium ampelinum]